VRFHSFTSKKTAVLFGDSLAGDGIQEASDYFSLLAARSHRGPPRRIVPFQIFDLFRDP